MSKAISTLDELKKISFGDYYLTNDIDCTGENWRPRFISGSGWINSSLDGKGFTLSNLTITNPSTYYHVGFIGKMTNSSIRNLNLTNLSITRNITMSSSTYAWGGLVGRMDGGTIDNCSVSGSITVTNGNYIPNDVGGLVGDITTTGTTTIKNSSANITITMTSTNNRDLDHIAGLIGNADYVGTTTISGCYSTGSITLDGGDVDSIGGLIGQISNDYGYLSISNCYSTVDITTTNSDTWGAYALGGFIGDAYHSTSYRQTISNCYATGDVSCSGYGEPYFVGGFIGEAYTDIIEDCYSTGNVTVSSSGYDYSLTIEYIGGFAGQFYPYDDYSTPTIPAHVSNCYSTGNVIVTSPESCTEIGGFAGDGNIANGSCTDAYQYNCYATGNVTINSDSATYIGGFAGQGCVLYYGNNYVQKCYYEGTIDINIAGQDWGATQVGGFAGYASADNYTLIKDCYVKGTLTVDFTAGFSDVVTDVGGFIGDFRIDDYSYIANCYSDIDMTITMKDGFESSATYIGGFFGDVTKGGWARGINLFSIGDVIITNSTAIPYTAGLHTGGFAGAGGNLQFVNCSYYYYCFAGLRAFGSEPTNGGMAPEGYGTDELVKTNFLSKDHHVYNINHAWYGYTESDSEQGAYDFSNPSIWGFPPQMFEPDTTAIWIEHPDISVYPDFRVHPELGEDETEDYVGPPEPINFYERKRPET